jgi:FkbM family methyltransferase
VDSYQGRVVHHVYGGVPLTVALRDPLGEGWYDHDWAPQPELTFLLERSRLRGGARVFDLGAHHGVVALMCAAHVGDGLVVAVEAEPHNAAVASENARLNAGLPLLVEHAAVAAQSGTLWFSEGLNGAVRGGGRAGKVPVPAVTIDELAKRHGWPDVVLIDVEGFEGRAIEGASDVLAIGKTDFCIEIHDAATLGPHGWDSRQLTDHLVACGATVWIAPAYDQVAGEFAPVESASVEWDRRLFCVALFD